MSDLGCPYCETGLDICHDDGFGYEEGMAHEMECRECGKNFTFHTNISFSYWPEKADCLNGSPHPFRDWKKLWEHKGKRTEWRQCKTCHYNERRVVEAEKEDA
jgi:hypothetical protein